MWAIIGTWRMAKEAIEKSLVKYESAADLIVNAIKEVEDFPYFSQ